MLNYQCELCYTDSDNFFYAIFYYYSGIASMGVVCDTRSGAQKNKQSISEVQDEVSTFAWVRYFYLLNYYLVQLIEQPILRVPNILFVYFLSLFSR